MAKGTTSMSTSSAPTGQHERPRINHPLRPMSGRDPHETGRAASPLELLFDLTFVVAFANAGVYGAHALENGHWLGGIVAFSFAMFAIIWAWINYSWFASAFDTDDWLYRALTMVQMIGVVVLSLGLQPMFHSFESLPKAEVLHNGTMILGYVIMRVALIAQWVRAYRQCPQARSSIRLYIITLAVSQALWIGAYFLHLDTVTFLLVGLPIYLVEMAGPYLAERKGGTPWHAHHIAERYSLMAIIVLGEGVVGAVVSLGAVLDANDGRWTLDTALVALAGMGLTFGMWWIYFTVPVAQALHAHRERSFGFGYGHMLIFPTIAATGMGLHVTANYIGGEAHISELQAVATVAVPFGLYALFIYALYFYLLRSYDAFHTWMLVATFVVLGIALALAASQAPTAWALAVLMVAPFITVVGAELHGYKDIESALDHL